MNRATTPAAESHDPQTHHPNPTRAKIQSAIEFCDAMKIPYFKNNVFRVFNVPKTSGWKMLNDENFSRTRHNIDAPETRGRHSIITPKHIREMERILKIEGIEARGLT